MSIIQEDSYWNMSNEIPEKFDNRQDISAKNFRSYILKKCKEEQENEEKLHESKVRIVQNNSTLLFKSNFFNY